MSVDLQETHAIGDRAEQLIAGGMSGNLINLRKAIDVEEYERTAGSAGLRVVVERFEQLVTIEQTGERVVGREKRYRRLCASPASTPTATAPAMSPFSTINGNT